MLARAIKSQYNNYTGDTAWEKPEGFDAAKEEAVAKGGGSKGLMSPLLRAALRIQAVFRAKKGRMRMRGVKAIANAKADDGGSPSSVWIEEHVVF